MLKEILEMEKQSNMKNQVIDQILKSPVIPVFYDDDVDTCIKVLKSCYAGGIRVFEFVNRGPFAEQNFKILRNYKEEHFPDLKLGIGTIMHGDDADRFIELGTDFLVSPIFSECVVATARKNEILWIPGCMTPTEIADAQFSGCTFIKLFPGDTLGPGFLKSIKPIFPKLRFMPTGGVDCSEESISKWFDAGVSAVGLGSKLFVKINGEYQFGLISENCSKLLSWAKREKQEVKG